LQQLEKEDVALRSMLAQQDAVLAALDKTKDLVIITDLKHNIQVNIHRIERLIFNNFKPFYSLSLSLSLSLLSFANDQ